MVRMRLGWSGKVSDLAITLLDPGVSRSGHHVILHVTQRHHVGQYPLWCAGRLGSRL